MLNITNHQVNANQNHTEIPSHTCQNSYHQQVNQQALLTNMEKKETLWSINVEKKEPLWSIGGITNWYSHYGKWYEGSSKH